MLVTFNLIYTLISTPAGSLSDRIGRRSMIIGGWIVYAVIYLGFGLAQTAWHVWVLYALYGLYYGMAYGTAKALVADLVPAELRGTAYGTYNAMLGILDFPPRSSPACSGKALAAGRDSARRRPLFSAACWRCSPRLLLGMTGIGRNAQSPAVTG